MIKVLIAEDSPVTKELLINILNSDEKIQVIGTVSNGREAIEFVKYVRPDIITMDINMPKMDGLEAIRMIMATNPVPIIIVSEEWKPEDVEATLKAMEVGALSIVEKPWGLTEEDFEERKKTLLTTVKAMSEIKVIKRKLRAEDSIYLIENDYLIDSAKRKIEIIGIGASTGGPPVIQNILSKLPEDFPVPILIVQHIALGFIEGFIELLNNSSRLPVSVASHNEIMKPGNVYFAADSMQMKVGKSNNIILTNENIKNGIKPSVSCLFESIAKIYKKNAIGVLLTGMGKDGANELLLMKEKGAITIAQDKNSSVVHGMPGEAIKLGAVDYILSADDIPEMLQTIIKNNNYEL